MNMNIDKSNNKDTKLIDDVVSFGDLLDKHYRLRGYKGYEDFCSKNKATYKHKHEDK